MNKPDPSTVSSESQPFDRDSDLPKGRERYVDFLRGFSLLVVVLWHWVFTLIIVKKTGITASNPIKYTRGLWAATWLLQVMPIFFFVGGFAHRIVWKKVKERNGGYWTFVKGRVNRLIPLALIVVAIWVAFGLIAAIVMRQNTTKGTIAMLIPPAWLLLVVILIVAGTFLAGMFRHQGDAGGAHAWVVARLEKIRKPLLIAGGFWLAIGLVAGTFFVNPVLQDAIVLIVSPLWFLAIYALLVFIAPAAIWAHHKWGVNVLVFLAAITAICDVVRFKYDLGAISRWTPLVEFISSWAFCHQLGFFYGRFSKQPRISDWGMFWAGFFTLCVLVGSKIYPGTMVGVPGDKISNMGPPNLAMLGVMIFQVGLAMLLRPWVTDKLNTEGKFERFSEFMNRFSLPVYLFHSTGLALAFVVYALLFGMPPTESNTLWWLTRPVWIVLPAIFTFPIVRLFGGKPSKPAPKIAAVVPTTSQEQYW